MKEFILGCALTIIAVNVLVFSQDNSMYQEQMLRLKFVCEEAAAAGAQYRDVEQYSNGKFVFNQESGNAAIKDLIIYDLKLDNNLVPLANTYFKDKITYTVTYYDESNTDFTKDTVYTDPGGLITHHIKSPTVVVSINAGKARLRSVSNSPSIIRTAAHSWISK